MKWTLVFLYFWVFFNLCTVCKPRERENHLLLIDCRVMRDRKDPTFHRHQNTDQETDARLQWYFWVCKYIEVSIRNYWNLKSSRDIAQIELNISIQTNFIREINIHSPLMTTKMHASNMITLWATSLLHTHTNTRAAVWQIFLDTIYVFQ